MWEDGACSWSVIELDFWHLDVLDMLSLIDVAEVCQC